MSRGAGDMKKIETKSPRVRRELEKREPQIVEGTKQALLLKGPKCSVVASKAIRDLTLLKKPDAKLFQKRNLTRPFEDQTSVEFLCGVNDTALFGFASSSKKRPHNLVLGRMFDGAALDMIEFGIDINTFKTMKAFTSKERKGTIKLGSKAAFVFQGDEWAANPDMAITRNLLSDFFRGDDIDKVNLASMDRVIVCTTVGGGKILFRHYAVVLKKSGTKYPRVELDEAGPRMDLTFRRRKSATDDTRKQAMRLAAGDSSKPAKVKNIERNAQGDKTGRIHLKHQDYNKISLFKGARALQAKAKRKHDGSGESGAPAGGDAKSEAKSSADAQFAVAAATDAHATAAAAAPAAPKPKKKERLKGQARWASSKKQRKA